MRPRPPPPSPRTGASTHARTQCSRVTAAQRAPKHTLADVWCKYPPKRSCWHDTQRSALRVASGWGLESLESRAKAAARLDLEESVGWANPSSRGLWGGDALALQQGKGREVRSARGGAGAAVGTRGCDYGAGTRRTDVGAGRAMAAVTASRLPSRASSTSCDTVTCGAAEGPASSFTAMVVSCPVRRRNASLARSAAPGMCDELRTSAEKPDASGDITTCRGCGGFASSL